MVGQTSCYIRKEKRGSRVLGSYLHGGVIVALPIITISGQCDILPIYLIKLEVKA